MFYQSNFYLLCSGENMLSLKEEINRRITENKSLQLDEIARECGTTELEAARAMPQTMCYFAPKDTFDTIWAELTTWEKSTFIIQSKGSVFEVKGKISQGKYGHGYFNLMGEEGLNGHLKVDDLETIAFMTTPFMGMESMSLRFFNNEGAIKFSIYAGRNKDRKIIPSVSESFHRLKESVSTLITK